MQRIRATAVHGWDAGRRRFVKVWEKLPNWGTSVRRGLAINWAPVLSIGLGIAAVVMLPEVRDLLIYRQATLQLLGVNIAVLLLWSLPIYVWAVGPGFASGRRRTVALLLGVAPFIVLVGAAEWTKRLITDCEVIPDHNKLEACLDFVKYPDRMALINSQTVPTLDRWSPVSDAVANSSALVVSLLLGLIVALGCCWIEWRFRTRHGVPAENMAWSANFYTLGMLIVGVVLLATVAFPMQFSDVAGPLGLVPALLGTWLAPLALIRRGASWMVRAAVVVLIAALGVFDLWFQPGFHDVRLFESAEWMQAKDEADRDFKRQPLIGEVLDEWLQANGCDPAAPSACQRQPIIVAAEGGAARSAFFASTMLGAVMDVAHNHSETFADPSQQIFLMSGVSGGSLGIGTFQAALLDAAPGGAPPCRFDQVDWGAGAGTASSDDPSISWRACLQALVSGDFITPTLAGSLFRDLFGGLFGGDRAVALEQAIERHYRRLTRGEARSCGPTDEDGLCRPMGYLGTYDGWQPLLILNSTEATSGRPVLIGDLQTAVAGCPESAECTMLLPTAHNIFELIDQSPRDPYEPHADELPPILPSLGAARDLRLSTAMVLSARFPLVSPSGIVTDEGAHHPELLTDATRGPDTDENGRLVDGGYFDNSGITSTIGIVSYLQDRGLRPVVLIVRSSPTAPSNYFFVGRPTAKIPVNDSGWTTRLLPRQSDVWTSAFSYLKDPLSALNMARSGHVELARASLYGLRGRLTGVTIIELTNNVPFGAPQGRPGEFYGEYCGEAPSAEPFWQAPMYKAVVNWSLSPLSRSALNVELCDDENSLRFERLLDALRLQPRH